MLYINNHYIMESETYKEFKAMEPSKQISFVQEQKQGEPRPIPDMSKKFPETNFV